MATERERASSRNIVFFHHPDAEKATAIIEQLTNEGFVVEEVGDLTEFGQSQITFPRNSILLVHRKKLNDAAKLKQEKGLPFISITDNFDTFRENIEDFNRGADGVIHVSDTPEVKRAFINAALRPYKERGPEFKIIKNGNVEIDINKKLVTKNGQRTRLTSTQMEILLYLSRRANNVCLYNDILVTVWGSKYRGDVLFLRPWVSRIRFEIEDDPQNPQIIQTRTGIGYILNGEIIRTKSSEG